MVQLKWSNSPSVQVGEERRKNLEIARTELGVSAGFFPQVKSMPFCKA